MGCISELQAQRRRWDCEIVTAQASTGILALGWPWARLQRALKLKQEDEASTSVVV